MDELKLRQYIRNFIGEIKDDELDETTATGNADGYGTPNAFTSGTKKDDEKKKENSTNSTGYKMVKEAIDENDVKIIKKLIRNVIADVYRDIWLKRNTWK